ncbi:MAG: undecaprenyl-phosphate glucose phosphotransferase [Azoarcus sp.]|jgi:putative colanic acid biosynthesis UDP-glucose lipid carrier transferase|nr:undecaprenyl-phosphate glucose phosphotransferase [Azoarcus sp.]
MSHHSHSDLLPKRSLLWRNSFTLSSAIEAFLYPTVIVLALVLAAVYYGKEFGPHYVILATLAFAVTFPGDAAFNETPRHALRKLLLNWLLFVCIMGAFGIATRNIDTFPEEVLRAWVIATPIVYLVAYFALRITLPKIILRNERRAIIVGANEIGIRLAQQFIDNPYLATHIIGFFDERSPERLQQHTMPEAPILGRMRDLSAFVKERHIEAIYLTLPMATQPRILNLLDDLKDTTASIYFVPDIFVTDIIQGRFGSAGSMPVVAVCETPFTGFDGLLKRSSDIVLSFFFLLLLLPLMLILAICVKLSSPGPVIFKQRRYGLDGREILVYKFRSMTVCDDGDVIKQATKNDQRITRFGAFIRKTSMDELPQFVNVLQGRMSIVGPRPHAVSHNETYRKTIKGYMVRHKVKPGITGWAQINGCRGETETMDKMEKRIEYDLEYLRNWSLSLDLWIIAKTTFLILTDRNAY